MRGKEKRRLDKIGDTETWAGTSKWRQRVGGIVR